MDMTMEFELKKTLEFLKLLHRFQGITRTILVSDGSRRENDIEHSYQLAMLAWYIIDSKKLPLDIGLVLKYALVHDLAEAYAGDTYVYTQDDAHRESKFDREKIAREQIFREFSEADEIHRLMEMYESREDAESRFIYVLDKLHPVFNIYLNSGTEWREYGVTLDMIVEYKREKVRLSPELEPYFNALVDILSNDEQNLFGKKTFLV